MPFVLLVIIRCICDEQTPIKLIEFEPKFEFKFHVPNSLQWIKMHNAFVVVFTGDQSINITPHYFFLSFPLTIFFMLCIKYLHTWHHFTNVMISFELKYWTQPQSHKNNCRKQYEKMKMKVSKWNCGTI